MFLVLVEDWRRVAEDYLLVVREGDQLYVLDSKQDAFEDPNQTQRYKPLLAVNSEGGWLFGRRNDGGGVNISYANLRGAGMYGQGPQPVDTGGAQPAAGRR
jgi:hypothetical protein